MRTSLAAMALICCITARVIAQQPSASDKRVYTINVGHPPGGTFGNGSGYPRRTYLPPYRDPGVDYGTAYQNYRSPYGYQTGGYGGVYPGQSSLGTYNSPVASFGGPTYLGQPLMYLNPYNGSYYAPSLTYQNRRYGSGRAFPYAAQPSFQPRLGGAFDR